MPAWPVLRTLCEIKEGTGLGVQIAIEEHVLCEFQVNQDLHGLERSLYE